MGSIITSRRSFLAGLGALVAAPAIVRVSSIMPVKVIRPPTPHEMLAEWARHMTESNKFILVPESFNVMLEAHLNAASAVLARNLADHLDTLVYQTGTGAGGLNELLA
jgi:fumarate hydratase class II